MCWPACTQMRSEVFMVQTPTDEDVAAVWPRAHLRAANGEFLCYEDFFAFASGKLEALHATSERQVRFPRPWLQG